MRSEKCDFKMNYTRETGSMAKNNSVFDFVELGRFACWIAVDVSSKADQEIAGMVVSSILNDFRNQPTIKQRKIKEYIGNARAKIANLSAGSFQIGLAVAVTDYTKMLCVAAGNERLYYLQRGRQNSEIAWELKSDPAAAKAGLQDYEAKAPGGLAIKTITLGDGDVIFICNSGCWKNLSLSQISETLPGADEPFVYLYNLKQLLLQKWEEALVSYLMVAIFANRVYQKKWAGAIRWAVIAAALSLVVGLLVLKPVVKLQDWRTGIVSVTKVTREVLTKSQQFNLYEQQGDRLVKREKYTAALEAYKKALNCKDSHTSAAQTLIERKLEITQMIIDADRLAAKGKLEAALAKYWAAQKTALEADTYDCSGLEKRSAIMHVKIMEKRQSENKHKKQKVN